MLRFKSRRRASPALKPQGELTASERRVVRLMVDAMDDVVSQVERDLTRIADAVAHSPADKVVDLVSVDPWYDVQEKLEGEFLSELLDAGSRVELPTMEKATLRYSFDRARPESAAWARLRAANLVREISEGQRQTIRDVVVFGQESGLSPDDTARQVRQTVGLTQAQGGWVNNFRDRQVAANMSAGMGLSDAVRAAEGPTARYQSQIHRYRSMTIARTEIMSANSQGRQQAWSQGIQSGFIGTNALKEWIAEADACDICAPRNGTRQPVNKPWPGGEPPAHPNCRCDLLLIPTPVTIPRRSVGDLLASFAGTILQNYVLSAAELLADFAMLRLLRAFESVEDVKDRADAIAELRELYAAEVESESTLTLDAGLSQSITDRVRENGGLSVSMVDGSEPTEGFMVAKGGKQSAVLDADEFYDPARGYQALSSFLQANRELSQGAYLGLWDNSAGDGKVYLDVSENIMDREAAILAGRERDQISIWDVANFEEIDTGGTGKVGKAVAGSKTARPIQDVRPGDRRVRIGPMGKTRGEEILVGFEPGRRERAAIFAARSYQEGTGLRSFSRTKRDSFSVSVDGERRRVRSVSRFCLSDEVRTIFESVNISVPDVFELNSAEADLFYALVRDAKRGNKFGASVELHEPNEYAGMRLFLTAEGDAGFALKAGDELVSVFQRNSNLVGIADLLVHLGIEQGARRAEAYDTALPYIYGDHGLSVVARIPWSDKRGPRDWQEASFRNFNNGEPDVVFMVYNPSDYLGYSPGMGRRFNKDEYDEAYEYAKLVLKWLNRRI